MLIEKRSGISGGHVYSVFVVRARKPFVNIMELNKKHTHRDLTIYGFEHINCFRNQVIIVNVMCRKAARHKLQIFYIQWAASDFLGVLGQHKCNDGTDLISTDKQQHTTRCPVCLFCDCSYIIIMKYFPLFAGALSKIDPFRGLQDNHGPGAAPRRRQIFYFCLL